MKVHIISPLADHWTTDVVERNSRGRHAVEPSLLQTVFSGLWQEDLPALPAHGADWARFHARLDRRAGWRRGPESAAFFFAMQDHASISGYSSIAVSATREHGTELTTRIDRPPAPIDLHPLH